MPEPDPRECCATTTDCQHADDCNERPATEFLGRFGGVQQAEKTQRPEFKKRTEWGVRDADGLVIDTTSKGVAERLAPRITGGVVVRRTIETKIWPWGVVAPPAGGEPEPIDRFQAEYEALRTAVVAIRDEWATTGLTMAQVIANDLTAALGECLECGHLSGQHSAEGCMVSWDEVPAMGACQCNVPASADVSTPPEPSGGEG